MRSTGALYIVYGGHLTGQITDRTGVHVAGRLRSRGVFDGSEVAILGALLFCLPLFGVSSARCRLSPPVGLLPRCRYSHKSVGRAVGRPRCDRSRFRRIRCRLSELTVPGPPLHHLTVGDWNVQPSYSPATSTPLAASPSPRISGRTDPFLIIKVGIGAGRNGGVGCAG